MLCATSASQKFIRKNKIQNLHSEFTPNKLTKRWATDFVFENKYLKIVCVRFWGLSFQINFN
jgi:hypothetical protein